jgi:hypothetical protein
MAQQRGAFIDSSPRTTGQLDPTTQQKPGSIESDRSRLLSTSALIFLYSFELPQIFVLSLSLLLSFLRYRIQGSTGNSCLLCCDPLNCPSTRVLPGKGLQQLPSLLPSTSLLHPHGINWVSYHNTNSRCVATAPPRSRDHGESCSRTARLNGPGGTEPWPRAPR